ncbi:MAG: type III pantothenate kinase [Aquificae bacterium]|nr:type III pantothenate kinase [Aquificota bacterium]
MSEELLTIDAGNTSVDIALWKNNKLISYKKLTYGELKRMKPIKLPALGVCVKKSAKELLLNTFPLLKLLEGEEIPIKTRYKNPGALGDDRRLLAFGASALYARNSVVISAGTALVLDLVVEGVHEGGFITLGLGKKLTSLTSLAEGIPPIEGEFYPIELGRSTEECVLGGILNESIAFVEKVVKLWSERYTKELFVVITGGEGRYLSGLGHYDELLAHRSLLLLSERLLRA